MNVVASVTHLGEIQTADPGGSTLPPKMQSHVAHLPRYASPATKAITLSQQSLACYLGGLLRAPMGIQALHLRHPTTALQPATHALIKRLAAHGGWPTSILKQNR